MHSLFSAVAVLLFLKDTEKKSMAKEQIVVLGECSVVLRLFFRELSGCSECYFVAIDHTKPFQEC